MLGGERQQLPSTPNNSSNTTATTTITNNSNAQAETTTTNTATERAPTFVAQSPSASSPPVGPQKLPGYLENLIDEGNWRKAVAVFESARRHEAARRVASAPPPASASAAVARDARSLLSRGAYNQALMAYAKGRDGQSALELLRIMRKAGGRLAPTRGSFNACLNVRVYVFVVEKAVPREDVWSAAAVESRGKVKVSHPMV